MTGVLDRLEIRGLIQRGPVGGDRRAIKVQLTVKGIELFNEVFPAHAEFMRPFFVQALNTSEVQIAKRLLRRVRDSFEGGNIPSSKAYSQPLQREKKPFLKEKRKSGKNRNPVRGYQGKTT